MTDEKKPQKPLGKSDGEYHDFVVEEEETIYHVDATCRICGEHRSWYLHK